MWRKIKTSGIRLILVVLLTVTLTELYKKSYNIRGSGGNRIKEIQTDDNPINESQLKNVYINQNLSNSQNVHRKLGKAELHSIYTEIIKWTQITKEIEKDPLLNRHQFEYTLNSDICHKYLPDVIIFVQSAVAHFDHRDLIRKSWATVTDVRNTTLRTVFMLGGTNNPTIQENIEKESSTYGDIVQGNLLDEYRNLPYKHIMALGWITFNCPDINLVVKVDDDTILNIYNLVEYSSKTNLKENILYCSVFYHQGPVRYHHDKWYVNTSTYPFEKYPHYCEGFGYLMSPDVARSLYKASEDTRFYWVDDVYVTGILALKVDLKLSCFIQGHSYRRNHRSDTHASDFMFLAEDLRSWNSDWTQIFQYGNKK